MAITDILIRSISGYIFIVPGLILYFGYLIKNSKKANIASHCNSICVLLLSHWNNDNDRHSRI
jgi:hypothetical protein